MWNRGLWVVVGIGLLVVFGTTGGAAAVEHHDPMCGACHTAPETEYLARRDTALNGEAAPDLASAHFAAADFDCIDCHNGSGRPFDRIETLHGGARDVLITLRGEADPTLEKGSVRNPHLTEQSCLGCHLTEVIEPSFQNHHHHMLQSVGEAWAYPGAQRRIESADPDLYTILTYDGLRTHPDDPGILCADCHQAHTTDLPEAAQFLDSGHFEDTTCNACHTGVRSRGN